MKIVIEARALSAQGGGVKNYTYELIRHLLKLKDVELSVIYDAAKNTGTFSDQVNEVIIPRRSDLLLGWWLAKKIPEKLKDINPDLVHFTKAAVSNKGNVPTVVTIYDVIPLLFPESQSITRRYYWPRALKNAAEKSNHIITISDASKRDIVKHLDVPSEKITVTKMPVNTERFSPVSDENKRNEVKGKYGIKKPYVLFVGTLEPRKNVPLLIRGFARVAKEVSHDLVIAGRKDKDYEAIMNQISALGLEERIKVIDFVDGDDLSALYSVANLFVWPSVYEGWGWPPQEAMACGVPVIVSDGGALPEVVGEAGETVMFTESNVSLRVKDEDFEIKLSEAMKKVLGDEVLREEMKRKGLEKVRERSWDEVAKETSEVYRQVVNK
jgi:glycosyltransferase involved in cell wall biosynthesis